MDIVIGFIIFIISMIICITTGYTMLIALAVGLLSFAVVAHRKGYSIRNIAGFSYAGIKDSLVVSEVMLLIGFVTAMWRLSGTITFFVYYGIKLITPSMFILITFFLCTILSYALGTSFGVAGTVGVIFMTLARSGDVNEIITAGAIMSGIYFGDRGSPASSSAILVATVTDTKLYDNLKMMMRTVLLPMGITAAIYLALSIMNPIHMVDQTIISMLENEFNISLWCIIPAACILVLPFLKVSVIKSLLASILSAILVSIFTEKNDLIKVLKTCIFGYESHNENLGKILNGGGAASMLEVLIIILISTSMSGLFAGTNMLAELQEKLQKLTDKVGRFWSVTIVGLGTIGVLCNQTVATMTVNDLFKKPYERMGATKEELAMDIENSVIVLSGTVPWTLACSVPLKFLQVGYEAILWGFLLYLIPITYGITKKRFFPQIEM